MAIYAWPLSLIRDLQRAIKRFIWSDDSSKRKDVTVDWNTICLPIEEGSLGLRSVCKLNEAFKLKLAWELINSDCSWAVLLRSRIKRKNRFITHNIFSSMWYSVKQEMKIVMDNSSWVLGNSSSISLWSDRWCGSPLFLHNDAPTLIEDHSVDRLLVHGSWDFSGSVTIIPALLKARIRNCPIPVVSRPDKRCWDNSLSGELSLKLAYDFKRYRGIPQVRWKMIWNKYFPPSISFMVWRLLHHKMPTDDIWHKRGFSFPSRWSLYGLEAESEQHLFFNCRFVLMLWSWLKSMFNLSFSILGWDDIWRILDKDGVVQCKGINLAAVFHFCIRFGSLGIGPGLMI